MEQNQAHIERPNLSGEIADIIRKMIFGGEFAPGERINEVELSQKLGVSRTPLRECLAGLASESALYIKPRRGVFVRELTIEEAKSIYAIRTLLDPEALSLSGVPTSSELKEATKINKALREATSVDESIALDDLWHLTLYRNCSNKELISLIKSYMQKTRRYELASMGDHDVLNHSYKSKGEIVSLLKKQDLKGACQRLRKSLTTGVDPVLKWLNKRNNLE